MSIHNFRRSVKLIKTAQQDKKIFEKTHCTISRCWCDIPLPGYRERLGTLHTDCTFHIEYGDCELVTIKKSTKITIHHQRPTAATKTRYGAVHWLPRYRFKNNYGRFVNKAYCPLTYTLTCNVSRAPRPPHRSCWRSYRSQGWGVPVEDTGWKQGKQTLT